MTMRARTAALAGTLALAASQAAAQDRFAISLGLGAGVAPEYEGARRYQPVPLWNLGVYNLYHPATYARVASRHAMRLRRPGRDTTRCGSCAPGRRRGWWWAHGWQAGAGASARARRRSMPPCHLAILMLAFAAFLAPAAHADPGPATTHVQRLLAEGQRVAAAPDRETQLGRLLDRDFDVVLIARTALGPAYARMSAAERTEYIALFHEQVVLSMVRQVVLTRVQDVVIIEARDLAAPESMIVTRMVDAQGRVQLASWWVRTEGERMKIIDVVADGASLTRGEVLRAVLQRNGGEVSALLAALRAQNTQMRAVLR